MERKLNCRSSCEKRHKLRRECAVQIIEQPAPKQQRFRYASEVDGSRSVGSIPGENSPTTGQKTYPTIRVSGYSGPMVVMLSLINPEDKLVHPHAVTGNDPRYHCTNGVIYTFVDSPEVVFNNVGVLCVKSKTEEDVTAALVERQKLNIDPFKAGFPHIENHRLINFSAVRLCFTVYIPEEEVKPADRKKLSKYNIDLKPVASTVVYDAKKLSDLKIHYVNKVAGSMLGGSEMVILCEKYTGVNPEVVFVEGEWEEKAEVKMYHKQMALVVITPPYRDPCCTRHVPVEVYLQRRGPRGVLERSAPAGSEYIPVLPRAHPSDGGLKRPPSDYIKKKQIKRPFMEHLSQYVRQGPHAPGTVDVQRAIEDFLAGTPSNYQESTSVAGPSVNYAPVQPAPSYWQQHTTTGSPNPLSQQEFSNADTVSPTVYTGVKSKTPNLYQDINSPPPNMMSYGNSLGPVLPNMYSVAPNPSLGYSVQGGASTSFHQDTNVMLGHQPSELPPYNFQPMSADFATNVAQEEVDMGIVHPLPNIITTASSSLNNQIPNVPDVLLPMSPDYVTNDKTFNVQCNNEMVDFKMVDDYIDGLIVNREINGYIKNADISGQAASGTGAGLTFNQSNFNPFHTCEFDPDSLSDELKKLGL